MSFLDSVLSSLNTGKSLPPLTSQPEAPTHSATRSEDSRNPGTRPLQGGNTRLKRKLDDQLRRQPNPKDRSPAKPVPSRPSGTSTPSSSRPKPTTTEAATMKPDLNSSASSANKPARAPVKPPPRGSFADLMARAKELQQKAPTNVGMLKHQTGPKERLNRTERKKRAMEPRTKEKNPKPSRSTDPCTKVAGVGGEEKRGPAKSSHKDAGKQIQPQQSVYRGTAGLPSRISSKDRKPQTRSLNEYMGTDEEDEGDYADGYDEYYSESTDMEAGLDDMEREEAIALESARREDEAEWQAELAAKKEKMERRKKLTMLASKR